MRRVKVWMKLTEAPRQKHVGWIQSESLSFLSSCLSCFFSSGVCAATSAVGTSRPSRSPSQSGPETPNRTERAPAAGIAPRPLQRRRVTLRPRPHPTKWTKGKWARCRVDVSACSEPLTGEFTESESKSFGYVSNSHSRYRISISAEFLHFKTYFQVVRYSCFPPRSHSCFSQTIYCILCKLQSGCKEESACSLHECVRAKRGGEKKSLRSFSFPNDVHTETMGRRSD